jgi:rhamnulokinase
MPGSLPPSCDEPRYAPRSCLARGHSITDDDIMTGGIVAAVDLGATSGRVILGHVGASSVQLEHVLRFPNGPVTASNGLHWDIEGLYRSILSGLRSAIRDHDDIRSIGVDSWAVDYARIGGGRMLEAPFHYRDERVAAGVGRVSELIAPAELYAANGLQFLPFNTLYQLETDLLQGRLDGVDRFLLVPDLINFWLGGGEHAERTNASTTGLLGVTSRAWDGDVTKRIGLRRSLFPELVDAGTALGGLASDVVSELGGGSGIQLSTVGSHDTASAVVAIPSTSEEFAYISCGTWGLVGVELEAPVLTEASRLANFTNEGGVDGRVRYLHNVMGLWLLSESVRTWEASGQIIGLPQLLEQAALVAKPVAIFDANDDRFLPPGDMPARIAAWCGERGIAAPRSPAEFVRSIIESLSDAFAGAVADAARLSGKSISVIHMVGGGSQNELLCQLTADRSGMPVLAGPVEATAIGNVLVQARAQGIVSGDLATLRAIVAASSIPRRYEPRPDSRL